MKFGIFATISVHIIPSGTLIGHKYDTIRDAILTCARKPTEVRLIYRTEPTTKKV